MNFPSSRTPTFGPLLVAGRTLQFLPVWPVTLTVNRLAQHLLRCHPGLKERLREIAGKCFLIVPDDLPIYFLLTIEKDTITCTCTHTTVSSADIEIRGSFSNLLALLNGSADGDTLFFSRGLDVSGDTSALVALRNIMDSENIDLLTELASAFGPMQKPARAFLSRLLRIHEGVTAEMSLLTRAFLAPLETRSNSLSSSINQLRNQYESLERKILRLEHRVSKYNHSGTNAETA